MAGTTNRKRWITLCLNKVVHDKSQTRCMAYFRGLCELSTTNRKPIHDKSQTYPRQIANKKGHDKSQTTRAIAGLRRHHLVRPKYLFQIAFSDKKHLHILARALCGKCASAPPSARGQPQAAAHRLQALTTHAWLALQCGQCATRIGLRPLPTVQSRILVLFVCRQSTKQTVP